VDDLRRAPDDTWTVARTNTEAIRLLAGGYVDEVVSIDHDICVPFSGELSAGVRRRLEIGKETFKPVAFYLSVMPETLRPAIIRFHTANPVGAEQMMGILKAAGIDSTYEPASCNVDVEEDIK
jgi:hypothetical protein